MSNLERVVEIVQRLNQIGTELAQDESIDHTAFLKVMLTDNKRMLEATLALVDSGITYVKWRKYFIQGNLSVSIRQFLKGDEYDRLCKELTNMDLEEYYVNYTLPVFEGGRESQVVEMMTNLVEVLESLQESN